MSGGDLACKAACFATLARVRWRGFGQRTPLLLRAENALDDIKAYSSPPYFSLYSRPLYSLK